jgi:hypothetical protein
MFESYSARLQCTHCKSDGWLVLELSSGAEPHHFGEGPAPGRQNDASSAPTPFLLAYTVPV